jgi:hypothetical protein
MKKARAIEAYHHTAPRQPLQLNLTHANPEGDPARWRERECFYVSIRDRTANDGSRDRYVLGLGPFRTHAEAEAMVGAVTTKAQQVDDRAWFYGYGTCKAPSGERAGVLNEIMDFEPA